MIRDKEVKKAKTGLGAVKAARPHAINAKVQIDFTGTSLQIIERQSGGVRKLCWPVYQIITASVYPSEAIDPTDPKKTLGKPTKGVDQSIFGYDVETNEEGLPKVDKKATAQLLKDIEAELRAQAEIEKIPFTESMMEPYKDRFVPVLITKNAQGEDLEPQFLQRWRPHRGKRGGPAWKSPNRDMLLPIASDGVPQNYNEEYDASGKRTQSGSAPDWTNQRNWENTLKDAFVMWESPLFEDIREDMVIILDHLPFTSDAPSQQQAAQASGATIVAPVAEAAADLPEDEETLA